MSYKRSRATFESDQQGLPHHAPFALYGTPLPAYESDARDDGSFVPVWKQTVTDERGRKRLHGAFTGGWSAGYFNTVGSKEGWTPSTFVSSRAKRAKDQKDGKSQEQRPEDFMDDEDLAEQAESQKLEVQTAFAGLGNSGDGGKDRGMFADLFRTSSDTMGVTLLQRMGWKPGQGVGPKLNRRAKGDEKGQLHLFAPENSRMIRFIRKFDRKGLGFAGEPRHDNDNGTANPGSHNEDEDSGDDARILRIARAKAPSKPKSLKKGAFGVGVLNDTGSDDDDPYSVGPRISYNRVTGGDKKKQKKKTKMDGLVASSATTKIVKATATSKKLTQRTTGTPWVRKCHDGRLPLAGFALSTVPLAISEANNFPPPEVPIGWTSSKQSSSTLDAKTSYQSNADKAKASTLDPTSRAALLGEQQLPGKSVFDFLSPVTRDRLAAASGKPNLPPGLGESAPPGLETGPSGQHRTLWNMVPGVNKQVAAAALQRGIIGALPFSNNLAKQARYKYFLELSVGSQSNLPERPNNMPIDEWTKELREFADTAEIFKPVSGIMASRFTAPSNRYNSVTSATNTASSESGKTEDPAERAARMGMYGSLTRSCQAFYPTRLLCKRFNIKPPPNVAADPSMTTDSANDSPGENRRLDLVSQSSLNRMMMEVNFKPPNSGSRSSDVDADSNTGPTVQTQPAVVDAEHNEALEGPRAGEAIFKAIFGDSDEDE